MTQATYRCTKCRRTKDIEIDNVHALLSHCTITKGCLGTLQKIGEVESFTADIRDGTGLVDWFPRGQEFNPTPVQEPVKMFNLSNSSSGALCLAVPQTTQDEIVVEFERKTTFGVSTQEFIKTIQVRSNTVSGRDNQNRIIRFEEDVILQNRIQVSLNGAQVTDFSVTTNSITFSQQLDVGTVVTIVVFGAVPVEKIRVNFTRHGKVDFTPTPSAWSSVNAFDRISYSFPNGQTWSVFSSPNFSVSSDSELRVSSTVTNEVFLLSLDPFSSVDRLTNCVVKLSDLSGTDFPLVKASGITSPLQYPEDKTSYDATSFRIEFIEVEGQATISTLDQSPPSNPKIIGPT